MSERKHYQVCVDVQNLWYAVRYAYGNSFRVDYKKLLDFIYDVTEGQDPIINSTAYVVASPNHDQTNFVNTLRMLGFNIKKRNLHYDPEKKNAQNTNWDVGITADALSQKDSYDTFILVSGDGDFIYMVEPLKDMGKEVYVLSFEKSLNRALGNSADKTYYLDDDVVYDPKERYRERQQNDEASV